MAWIDNTSDYFNNLALTSDQQDRLDLLLDAAQAGIEKFLGRTIESTEHDSIFVARQDGAIILDHFPIIHLGRILSNKVKTLTIQNTTATHASYSVTTTGIELNHVASGTRASNTVAFSGNATLSDFATAIAAVGSGWSASALTDYTGYPSSDLVAGQFGNATTENDLYSWDEEARYLEVDRQTGIIEGEFSTDDEIRIIYTAGYATASIPEDLKKVLADLALDAYDESMGGSVVSENLGDYSYQLGAMSERVARLGITNATILAQYKDRRV